VVIHVSDGGTTTSPELIRRLGDTLARAGQLVGAHGEIRVRLVADAEMAQAHEEFAGVPGTTDVLTFDLTDPEDDPIDSPTAALISGDIRVIRPRLVDADILVCTDEAARQAAARGHDLFHELLLYSIHALLHCLGHDDHEETDFAAMHALEDAILTRLGLGVVFGRAASDHPGKVRP
jgi:probable rRNA maturation factor